MTALENFTPLIGGIPIVVDGQIVGGVGVSGAATTIRSSWRSPVPRRSRPEQ